MPPYVGMARKQNGGYNASISVQTLIFYQVVNSTRLKTVRSALWRCPNSTVALRLLENVVNLLHLLYCDSYSTQNSTITITIKKMTAITMPAIAPGLSDESLAGTWSIRRRTLLCTYRPSDFVHGLLVVEPPADKAAATMHVT